VGGGAHLFIETGLLHEIRNRLLKIVDALTHAVNCIQRGWYDESTRKNEKFSGENVPI
jgi:hypothetical protein